MRRKYGAPPVNEVVIGAYLREPLIEMRAEHIGFFWAMVKDEFQKSAQQLPIGNIDIPVPGEILPLPRFWFISQDDSTLLQIQRNAIIFNWRKREGVYPHYESIKARFDELFGKFSNFTKEHFGVATLRIAQCELNYVNAVQDEEYFRSFPDTKNVIPAYAELSLNNLSAARYDLAYSFNISSDMLLNVKMQSRQNANTQADVLYFELRATGALPEQEGTKGLADIWFDKAHEVIGDAFNTLTSKNIQERYWQPLGD